ncbi:hypothetical protein EV129_114118 [Rhizobium azibense]|uniref:Uncharacterized protein n=1 Tax=Rhizobium azibense TaxID=1136135 RepID=A0A4R3RQM3_9HYPH|nr:hypothetical protein EV129_114118 [Rhizobium azibense]
MLAKLATEYSHLIAVLDCCLPERDRCDGPEGIITFDLPVAPAASCSSGELHAKAQITRASNGSGQQVSGQPQIHAWMQLLEVGQ